MSRCDTVPQAKKGDSPVLVKPCRKRKHYASERHDRIAWRRTALAPPAPAPLPVAADQRAQRPFTPEVVDDGSRCLARTWNGGRGGQCKAKPAQDGLCKVHLRSHAHGLVTGDIPAAKLAQFEAHCV